MERSSSYFPSFDTFSDLTILPYLDFMKHSLSISGLPMKTILDKGAVNARPPTGVLVSQACNRAVHQLWRGLKTFMRCNLQLSKDRTSINITCFSSDSPS